MPFTTFGSSPVEEGMGEIDIFADDHTGGYVAAHQHLIGAGAQDGAEDQSTRLPPAFGQMAVDQRVDAELLAHHAFHDVAEELRLGVAISEASILADDASRTRR